MKASKRLKQALADVQKPQPRSQEYPPALVRHLDSLFHRWAKDDGGVFVQGKRLMANVPIGGEINAAERRASLREAARQFEKLRLIRPAGCHRRGGKWVRR